MRRSLPAQQVAQEVAEGVVAAGGVGEVEVIEEEVTGGRETTTTRMTSAMRCNITLSDNKIFPLRVDRSCCVVDVFDFVSTSYYTIGKD